jgi:hypothetical protein
MDPQGTPGAFDALKADIVRELNLAHLPSEMQDQIIDSVSELLVKAVIAELLNTIPEAKHDAFGAIAETGDSTLIELFLKREVPDFEEKSKVIVAQELAAIKARTAELVAAQ